MIASTSHIPPPGSLVCELEKSSKSLLMQDIFYKIISLAKLDSPHIIIVGEIGSGKKRLAKVIHQNSSRAKNPFYTFYCVDIDEEKYKDAFWGHLQFEEEHLMLRYDALEKANGGTLYLDQFSELTPEFMVKIVTSFIKGTTQLYRFDKTNKPRLIISMSQELYQNILNTQTWDIILAELNPFLIMLPPLRERKEDIPLLIDFFLDEIRKKEKDWKDLSISSQAMYECFNYSWPGNIRQLKNALLQGAILSYGQTIECQHLPFSMAWKLPYEMNNPKS